MIIIQLNGRSFLINFTTCNNRQVSLMTSCINHRLYLKYFRRVNICQLHSTYNLALHVARLVVCLSFYMSELFGWNMAEIENVTKNFSGPVDANNGTSKGWQAFQIIFWTFLSAAAVIGNGLVLVCVLLKKRRNSSTFKFYGSLALGDLLVG